MDAANMRATRIVVGALVAAAMVAGLLVVVMFIGRGGGDTEAPVYLEATEQPGENPFVPAAAIAPQSAPGRAQSSPDSPGSNELGKCDPARLIAYLTSHREAAEAWIGALDSDATLTWSGGHHVTVDQIPAYIKELRSVTLSGDRRVTNHQFVNGTAVSVQSVLQVNTAVLIDASGVPRVRCACGNPLTPMRQITAPPKYVGRPWSGFTPVVVVIVDRDTPRCDDNEYYDGDRCRPIKCPDPQELGADGRCYDPDPPPPCPDGSVKPRDSGCPTTTPTTPSCPEGSAGSSTACPSPRTCPDGSEQGPCATDPSCTETIRQTDADCSTQPRCPDGSLQELGTVCTALEPPPTGCPADSDEQCLTVQAPSTTQTPPTTEQPTTTQEQPVQVCPDGSVQPADEDCPEEQQPEEDGS